MNRINHSIRIFDSLGRRRTRESSQGILRLLLIISAFSLFFFSLSIPIHFTFICLEEILKESIFFGRKTRQRNSGETPPVEWTSFLGGNLWISVAAAPNFLHAFAGRASGIRKRSQSSTS